MNSPPMGAGAHPLNWPSLRFNPVGLYDLRRRLGFPSAYALYKQRFDLADIAWFSAGLASESCSTIAENEFYPEFQVLRANTPKGNEGTEVRNGLRKRVRDLTFDTAAMWDRAFGGTTLIIHVDGTTRPGSPKRPEFVKADVYFPGHLLNLPEHARISAAISDIVQKFITDIGISTIARYEQCAASHWPLGSSSFAPLPYPIQHVQPAATPPNSSTFIYHGRAAVVVFDDDDDADDDDDKLSPSQHQLLDNMETCAILREQLKNADDSLRHCQDSLTSALRRERDLLSRINQLSNVTTPSRFPSAPSTPHTPQRSSVHTNRILKSPGVRFSPNTVVSPKSTPSRHGSGSTFPDGSGDAQSSHAGVNSNTRVLGSPVRLRPGNPLAEFVHIHGLDDSFPYIDLVRRNIAPFLWKNELSNLGLDEDSLGGLMAGMAAVSAQSDASPGSGASSPFS